MKRKEKAMAERRRNPAIVQQDEDTSDLDGFHSRSDNYPEKPVQRNAANARERARMRVLSRAFCRLKTSLPMVPTDTKLSKLDTLRLAATYIAHLRKILREDGEDGGVQVIPSNTRNCSTHPVTLTWPFMFNSRSAYGDYSSIPSMTENNRPTDDFGHDAITDYREFVPCDYLAMNHTEYHRRETMEHYLEQ